MKTKKQNRINEFMQKKIISKIFKVILIDFFAKKQKLRNSIF